MSIRGYVKRSANLLTESDSANWTHSPVEVLDPLPEDVDLGEVLNHVDKLIPEKILQNIQKIEISDSVKLKKRGVDAILEDGRKLVITNNQQSNRDLIEDIVHEVAHLIERQYADKIYDDEDLKREFISKRKALSGRLKAHGYDISKEKMMSTKYDEKLDNFFWKKVGYDELAQYSHDLFLSPYAATSLREYWADAFEDYILLSPSKVKKYSPAAYKKIQKIMY